MFICSSEIKQHKPEVQKVIIKQICNKYYFSGNFVHENIETGEWTELRLKKNFIKPSPSFFTNNFQHSVLLYDENAGELSC